MQPVPHQGNHQMTLMHSEMHSEMRRMVPAHVLLRLDCRLCLLEPKKPTGGLFYYQDWPHSNEAVINQTGNTGKQLSENLNCEQNLLITEPFLNLCC